MTDIAHRAEQAKPDEARGLLEELALAMLRSEDPAHWLTRAEKARLYARAILPILRAARERVLEEAARKAEHSCYDYANTIEPSINDDGSKAFGFGFDYACEVIAAAIRALQEPKV